VPGIFASILPAMPAGDTTTLSVAPREVEGSRSTRRLRRGGAVPGIVYGGGEDPIAFQVDARILRQALAHAGAVVDLSVDGAKGTPVVLKDLQRHPVTGAAMHVDLLRVRLDVAIQTTVVLDLQGADDAPGVKVGGVLEQITREVNIEALPTAIPDSIVHDVSGMEMNDTLTLASITVPEGVNLLDELETVVATLTPPRLTVEPEEIETETEVVGEDGEKAEADASAEGDSGGE
jgi:large subunit ribosomal protein L25